MKSMRVLIYVEAFYPDIGGRETFVWILSQHLHELGVRVTVITETAEKGERELPFRVIRRPSQKDLKHAVREADIVFLNSFKTSLFLWAKLLRKKVAVTYHDVTPICPRGTKWKDDGPCLDNASLKVCVPCLRKSPEGKVVRRLVRPIVKSIMSFYVDANICVSPFGMLRFPIWNKKLISLGIDTDFFRPDPKGEDGGIPRALFMGRLIPDKGCQVLIEALRISEKRGVPFHVDVCGDGPYRPELEALVSAHGLRDLVHFHGMLQGEQLLKIMQKADMAVLPSLMEENGGTAGIEALSCGLPLIVSNVGGIGSLVSEAGFTFERGDAEGLAGHLMHLAKNPSLRREIGMASRRHVSEDYDYRIMGDRYYRVFSALTGSGDGNASERTGPVDATGQS